MRPLFHSLSRSGALQAASGLWLGSGSSLQPRWLDHLLAATRDHRILAAVILGLLRRSFLCKAADMWPNSGPKTVVYCLCGTAGQTVITRPPPLI